MIINDKNIEIFLLVEIIFSLLLLPVQCNIALELSTEIHSTVFLLLNGVQ